MLKRKFKKESAYNMNSGNPNPYQWGNYPSHPGSTAQGYYGQGPYRNAPFYADEQRQEFTQPLLQHLQQLTGKRIVVSTTDGKIDGTLGGVFSDHILVEASGKKYHINLDHIVYVQE
jgi:hypothetical protein